jgi:hypothetical protein
MAFETSDSEARSADLVRETMNYVWTWNRPLGSGRTIPATSLYGIFEVHSLWSTQNNGLTIF